MKSGTKLALAILFCAVGLGALPDGATAQRRGRVMRPAPAERRVEIDERALASAEGYARDRFEFFTETPRGALVAAVNRPRPEMLRAIDDGLSELFEVARRRGYARRLDYADYTVFVARADRTQNAAREYSPDVAIGASQYAGSVYDQGGFVYAAGIVSSFSPCAFVIAEHERDWRRVSNVVRYEGEHLVLYHNDRRLYQQTYDHSRGGGHPILK
jgi:hypothetical protein